MRALFGLMCFQISLWDYIYIKRHIKKYNTSWRAMWNLTTIELSKISDEEESKSLTRENNMKKSHYLQFPHSFSGALFHGECICIYTNYIS
jgi:hypothetical protein